MYRQLAIAAAFLAASAAVEAQTISTLAGAGTPTFCGDGGAASSACLYYPYGVAIDATGNVFIADSGNHRVRKVTPDGLITTVAGNGVNGFCGDGGAATSACLCIQPRSWLRRRLHSTSRTMQTIESARCPRPASSRPSPAPATA